MKLASNGLVVFLLAGLACYGQGSQSPVTADELEHLRFVLMSVGSIDHHAIAVNSYEDMLAKRFGLNSQESAVIHAAGQELNALLKQLHQSAFTIMPGRSGLSQADKATFAALAAQREDKLVQLANRILSQVRPETAARLRASGRVVAAKKKQ